MNAAIRQALGSLFVLAVGSAAIDAHAQDDTLANATARALFDEGVALGDRGEWAEAVTRFERAFELRASPVIARNLATAYTALGRLVDASEALRGIVIDDGARPDLRRAARAELDRIMPLMGRLTIRLEGPSDGVALAIDGRDTRLALVGTPIPADPGTRVVSATRDGEPVAETSVVVPEGGEELVTLTIPEPVVEAEAAAPEPTPAPAEIVERPSIWNWIVGGALAAGGLAFAIVGPIYTLARLGQVTRAPSGIDPGERVEFGAAAVVLTVVAVALIAGGTVVLVLQPFTTADGTLHGAGLRLHATF